MKFARPFIYVHSKRKLNYLTQNSRLHSLQTSNCILIRKSSFPDLILNSYNVSSVSLHASRLHTSSLLQAKHYQERENEYAHFIMEIGPNYSSSVLKHPLHLGDVNLSSWAYANAFDEFIKTSRQNFTSHLNLEDNKFTNLIKDVSLMVPGATDDDVIKILHALCLWPPTSKTYTRNFKLLWNTLDEECSKRLDNWNCPVHRRKYIKMASKTLHSVLVYGTLKIGEPNYYLLQNTSEGKAIFKGKGKTMKKWPLVIASRFNIPYLLYHEGKGKNIIGELFQVDDAMLAKLDELECHPKYYTRMQEDVELVTEGASKPVFLQAWIYFLKNFRPHLLDLPYLEEYSSKGSHGLEYIPSEDTSDPEDIYD